MNPEELFELLRGNGCYKFTKSELIEFMGDFTEQVLKLKSEMDKTFGMKVPDKMIISIIKKTMREEFR